MDILVKGKYVITDTSAGEDGIGELHLRNRKGYPFVSFQIFSLS